MSRGRISNTSTSAYEDIRSSTPKNKKFVCNSLNKIKKINEDIDKLCEKTRKELLKEGLSEIEINNKLEIIRTRKIRLRKGLFKSLSNSHGLISLTRDPASLTDKETRKLFHKFIKEFETTHELKLSNISKEEIIFIMFDHIEKTNSLIEPNDDSKKFFLFKFSIANVVKVYLYKAFYPRIFDYDVKFCPKSDDEEICFKSELIENNFRTIYNQVEELINSIIYDGFLISATELCAGYNSSLKKNCKINFSIKDDIDIIKEDLLQQITKKAKNDSRIGLLKYFIPSAIFLAKFYGKAYDSRKNINDKKIITILETNAFYSGSRADESRKGIDIATNICHNMLDEEFNFSRLLNLQYINEKTGLLDLNILHTNYGFKPYLLPGIIAKHHISKMISTNSGFFPKPKITPNTNNAEKQENKNDDQNTNKKEMSTLISIYNNPNCLIKNITLRDYEILNYIITKVALSIRVYYFSKSDKPKDDNKNKDKNKEKTSEFETVKSDKDIVPNKIFEFINALDHEKYTATMSKKVSIPSNAYFDRIDFDEVSTFKSKITDIEPRD